MDKKIQIIAIVGAIIFSVFVLTSPTDPIPLPAPTTNSENDSVNILAENLKKPRAIAVADEICSASELVMGKVEKCPIVIVRNYNYDFSNVKIQKLLRSEHDDLFR